MFFSYSGFSSLKSLYNRWCSSRNRKPPSSRPWYKPGLGQRSGYGSSPFPDRQPVALQNLAPIAVQEHCIGQILGFCHSDCQGPVLTVQGFQRHCRTTPVHRHREFPGLTLPPYSVTAITQIMAVRPIGQLLALAVSTQPSPGRRSGSRLSKCHYRNNNRRGLGSFWVSW